MKLFFSAALLCLTIILIPTLSPAQDVAVGLDHFPPWKVVENGSFNGIDVEMTKALLAEVGMTPTFIECPWARCLNLMQVGKLQFLSGVLKRPEREKYLLFIEPPYKTKSAKVFYRLKTSQDIKSIDDLHGKIIGVQRNAKYFNEFDNRENLMKEEVNDDKFNFLKLANGRVDTVLSTESQGDYLVSTLGLGHLMTKATYRHDETVPVYFAVSKRSALAGKIDELNAAAKRLKDNGTFDAIIRNYFDLLKSSQ
ncbi:transporter substrate-binding domain-containing protein [Pseudodesulfovibrio sp. zrk46]|uniref:substrate-binding periplasmic protein n=1 Tax=Pseudodesulfovibrio sp. zrk46 TaxID=2725288 RepID=UPI00144A095F|nr:transporter substrate-binding domain-containing protein [Pseudodesulfovibrio sp. zrk46]QJB56713.1 transporter substrate-binding domain-containing protein [Pseudodesulfovibrio sp. zrk46]